MLYNIKIDEFYNIKTTKILMPMTRKNKSQKEVTLKGTARNAKGGAVIVTSTGSPIYLDQVANWPDDVLGCEVEATGILRTKKYIPDPFIAPDGAISQGAVGEQDVLEHARWKKTK